MELLASQLPLLGSKPDGLKAYLEQGVGLVFFEMPTNLALEVRDIATLSGLAHEYGALVGADNTFASPVNQHPLELGADFVIHGATKYLGGHSDITAGALMGSAHLLTPLWPRRTNLDSMIHLPRPFRLATSKARFVS